MAKHRDGRKRELLARTDRDLGSGLGSGRSILRRIRILVERDRRLGILSRNSTLGMQKEARNRRSRGAGVRTGRRLLSRAHARLCRRDGDRIICVVVHIEGRQLVSRVPCSSFLRRHAPIEKRRLGAIDPRTAINILGCRLVFAKVGQLVLDGDERGLGALPGKLIGHIYDRVLVLTGIGGKVTDDPRFVRIGTDNAGLGGRAAKTTEESASVALDRSGRNIERVLIAPGVLVHIDTATVGKGMRVLGGTAEKGAYREPDDDKTDDQQPEKHDGRDGLSERPLKNRRYRGADVSARTRQHVGLEHAACKRTGVLGHKE